MHINKHTERYHYTKSFYKYIHMYAESLFQSFVTSKVSLIYGFRRKTNFAGRKQKNTPWN